MKFLFGMRQHYIFYIFDETFDRITLQKQVKKLTNPTVVWSSEYFYK